MITAGAVTVVLAGVRLGYIVDMVGAVTDTEATITLGDTVIAHGDGAVTDMAMVVFTVDSVAMAGADTELGALHTVITTDTIITLIETKDMPTTEAEEGITQIPMLLPAGIQDMFHGALT